MPEKCEMECANNHQVHASFEPTPAITPLALDDVVRAIAIEEGEEQIELPLKEHKDNKGSAAVSEPFDPLTARTFGAVNRKELNIDKKDSQKCKPS